MMPFLPTGTCALQEAVLRGKRFPSARGKHGEQTLSQEIAFCYLSAMRTPRSPKSLFWFLWGDKRLEATRLAPSLSTSLSLSLWKK